MKEKDYWNHNVAYHKWIVKQLDGAQKILDVGCGDGILIASLDDGNRILVGIDPFQKTVFKKQI